MGYRNQRGEKNRKKKSGRIKRGSIVINGPKPRKNKHFRKYFYTTQDLLKEINNYRKFFIPLFKAYIMSFISILL